MEGEERKEERKETTNNKWPSNLNLQLVFVWTQSPRGSTREQELTFIFSFHYSWIKFHLNCLLLNLVQFLDPVIEKSDLFDSTASQHHGDKNWLWYVTSFLVAWEYFVEGETMLNLFAGTKAVWRCLCAAGLQSAFQHRGETVLAQD